MDTANTSGLTQGKHTSILNGDVTSVISSEDERPRTFWKNLFVLSFSLFFTFTAYSSIQNLESTLNHSAGLGVASLACIYGGLTISCIYAPGYVSVVGPKWSIVTGLVTQLLFTISNFYPRFYTLLPSSVILGLASGILWTAQGVYITQLATDYAETIVDEATVYISRFNGIFYFIFQCAQISGNLISSIVLHDETSKNVTVNATPGECGASFCSWDSKNNTSDAAINPSIQLVYILMGIYAGCSLAGLLLFTIFADNRKQRIRDVPKSPRDMAVSTFKIHGNILLALVVPMFLWNGIEQSLLFGEYTQAFISCHAGIGHVGYAMVGFGVTDALFSLIVGNLEKCTGRVFLFLFGFTLNIALMIVMLLWDPAVGHENLLYVIPPLWGVGDAIWNATLCALIGVVFMDNQEPAFASFQMWQSIGFLIMMAISHYICMTVKIYIALATCAIAVVTYAAMEVCLKRRTSHLWTDLTDPVST